jgi:hypothetical protein
MRQEEERLIEMTVEIGGHRNAREDEIIRACMVEWSFRKEDFFHRPTGDERPQLLEASALGTLYGGEDADDIIHRLERAIWRVNGGMCHVEIRAVGLNSPAQWTPVIEENEHELQIV